MQHAGLIGSQSSQHLLVAHEVYPVGRMPHLKHLKIVGLNQVLRVHCSAGLRCLMCTGDFHGTALAVARGVGMIPQQGQSLIIIQKEMETRPASACATSPFKAAAKILQSQQEVLLPTQQNMSLEHHIADISEMTRARESGKEDVPVQHIASTTSVGQEHSALKAASKVDQPTAHPARQSSHGVSLSEGVEHPKVRPHHTVAFAEDVFGVAKQQPHQQAPDDAVSAAQNQPCSMSFSKSRYGASSSEYRGVVFHVDNSCETQDDALQALTAIAQVSMPCQI